MTLNPHAEIARAHQLYARGEPGWYTVNPETDRAVNGPVASEAEALDYAAEVQRFYGETSRDLVARLVGVAP